MWLARGGESGWVAIAKDTKILERPDELAALLPARIHIVFYPGTATRAELLRIAAATLKDVCAMASLAGGGVWLQVRESDFRGRRLRRVRLHDLRHTCASLAISSGANINVVQKLLGHKSAVLTLDKYGHLFRTISTPWQPLSILLRTDCGRNLS